VGTSLQILHLDADFAIQLTGKPALTSGNFRGMFAAGPGPHTGSEIPNFRNRLHFHPKMACHVHA
jgi:hypothetical protein